jgi:hypothetical protein
MKSQSICSEEGLSCHECTSATARELAKTCQGLRGKMVAQLFVQIYPAPECSRMHAHFAAEYRVASIGGGFLNGDVSEDIPRKGPAAQPARVMYAVA